MGWRITLMNYQDNKTFLQLWQAICDNLNDQGTQAILRDYLLECGESEPVATEAMVRRVLRPRDHSRYGHGYGLGSGDGTGYGYGSGSGTGYGSGDGTGYGYGSGYCYGSGGDDSRITDTDAWRIKGKFP